MYGGVQCRSKANVSNEGLRFMEKLKEVADLVEILLKDVQGLFC